MPPASMFLLAGLILALVLCGGAWLVMRPKRSSVASVEQYLEALRALSPRERV